MGALDGMVKRSPGPAVYSPARHDFQSGAAGPTFGPPRRRRGGSKVPPSAHDISRMISHLAQLPAPDAYGVPADPAEKHKGFRIRPSKAPSPLEYAVSQAAKVPGPGAYDVAGKPGGEHGRTTKFASGSGRSELERAIARAKELPGPGAHEVLSTLRTRGARLDVGGGVSLIEQIEAQSRHTPGPGAYHRGPTFAEELAATRYMRAVARGWT